MIGQIIRVVSYIILIIINIRLFIEKKKIHNFMFTIFFMLEGVRRVFLNQYLSETLQTGTEVFQLTLLMGASFLFFRDRKLEDKVKE
jgi:prolipoprotein diacylglyceryltransferase